MEFVNLKQQYFQYKSEIDLAIQEVLESGQFIMGKQIRELEQELEQFVGISHCIGVSSGTDALLLALEALEIGNRDEVICVPFTWVSPVECVRRLKAKPVFVDIDPQTFLIDVEQIERAITPRTKAIIPVSLYGQMPDFEKIMNIAQAYNLAVIEDGAQSFGATQNGKKSGSIATISATSFFPTKPLGCYGDGGAIFTNDSILAEKMRALRVHGAPMRYNHQYVGMNARLDTLQAAILRAKLPFFADELLKRAEIGAFFNENIHEVYKTPKVMLGNTHTFAQYTLRHPQRDKIIALLAEKEIPAAIYYPICIHLQTAYQDLGYEEGSLPHAEQAAKEVFNIPMHPSLTNADQQKIVTALNELALEEAVR